MINLEAGSLFGSRYKVIKQIGAGGMGAVYLARDPRYDDFFVAIKVLYPGIVKTRDARERLRNEIVASYRVNHTNVVRAYEYFDEEDTQAYAMEYVDGGDLLTRMARGKMPTAEVIELMKQIASGLKAIHGVGIIHRDLKPENILLSSTGQAKISDFGVARLKGSSTLTQVGMMVGTPKYLSPEYVETGSCDHRGDIYALGVIGYELITGQSPFRSESRVSLMVERLKSDRVPLLNLAPDCSPDLARIIEKAMSVPLTKRYQSAQEALDDLEHLQRGEPLDHTIGSEQEVDNAEPTSHDPSILPNNADTGPKWLTRKVVAVGTALLMVCLASWWKLHNTPVKPSLWSLKNGIYSGVATGVISDNSEYALKVWRTDSGVSVLLGKEFCKAVPVDRAGQFSCGDLHFEISVDTWQRAQAAGTMRELSWGTSGTWSLGQTEELGK